MEDNNESKGSRAHDWELLSMSMSTLDPKPAPGDSASESQHTEPFNAESIRDSKYFACPTPFENPGAESSAQEELKAKEEVAKKIPTEQLGPVGCLGEAAPSSSDDRAEMEEESAKKLSSHVATPKLHDADDKSPLKDSAIASCRTWWKRQSSMLISHMKEANAILSIAVAAAVVGLVILGHRWHQERCQNRQLHERVHELTNKLSRSARHRISVREAEPVPRLMSGAFVNATLSINSRLLSLSSCQFMITLSLHNSLRLLSSKCLELSYSEYEGYYVFHTIWTSVSVYKWNGGHVTCLCDCEQCMHGAFQ